MPFKNREDYNEYMRKYRAEHPDKGASYREGQKQNSQNKNALSTSFMEKVGNEINQKKKEEETKTE